MYKKILAALDIESASDRPIISAARLAREQQAELRAVAVVRPALLAANGFFSAELVDRDSVIEDARGALAARVAAASDGETGRDVVVGKPSEAIVSVARHRGSDLIVLGAQPREGTELILGTTATNILRLADGIDLYACHRADPETPTERITLAIDGSELTANVLAAAGNLAASSAADASHDVQVVCVVDGERSETEAVVRAAQNHLKDTRWRDLRVCVETDGIAHAVENAICEHDSDLLIIGSGRNLGPGWAIGSTTNDLLHEISCDVLVARR